MVLPLDIATERDDAPRERFRMKRKVRFADIPWRQVENILQERFKLSERQADRWCRSFVKRFSDPLNPTWFLEPQLTARDNKIIAAICLYFGADTVVCTQSNVRRFASVIFSYDQAVEFQPELKDFSSERRKGKCFPFVSLSILGKQLTLRKPREVVALHFALALVGLIAYIIVTSFLLYSVSVFIVFLENPQETTLAATERGSIGFALLCILVAIAGICGRSVMNVSGLLMKYWRERR